jgi:hypothetical protein
MRIPSALQKTPKKNHQNSLTQNKNANTGILERRDFREVNYHTVWLQRGLASSSRTHEFVRAAQAQNDASEAQRWLDRIAAQQRTSGTR